MAKHHGMTKYLEQDYGYSLKSNIIIIPGGIEYNSGIQYVAEPAGAGGGTHYVRVMGRLRSIDPLFQCTGKNIDLRPHFLRCRRKL